MEAKLNDVRFLTDEDIDKTRFEMFGAAAAEVYKSLPDVEALWWINEDTGDGGTQLLLKSPVPVKSIERIKLNASVAKLFNAEIIYDYDRDFVRGDGFIKSDRAEICKWLEQEMIYCLYKKEA